MLELLERPRVLARVSDKKSRSLCNNSCATLSFLGLTDFAENHFLRGAQNYQNLLGRIVGGSYPRLGLESYLYT